MTKRIFLFSYIIMILIGYLILPLLLMVVRLDFIHYLFYFYPFASIFLLITFLIYFTDYVISTWLVFVIFVISIFIFAVIDNRYELISPYLSTSLLGITPILGASFFHILLWCVSVQVGRFYLEDDFDQTVEFKLIVINSILFLIAIMVVCLSTLIVGISGI